MCRATIALPDSGLGRALGRLGSRVAGWYACFVSACRRNPADDVRVATVALLLDIAYSDTDLSPTEQEYLEATIRSQFGLSPRGARKLIAQAASVRSHDRDLNHVAATIARGYSPQQKARLVEIMRDMAEMDGVVSAEESYLVRRLRKLVRADGSLVSTGPSSWVTGIRPL